MGIKEVTQSEGLLSLILKMTKELKICLLLLVALSAVSAQSRPNGTSVAGRNHKSPRGFQDDPFMTFCEDNNVPTDTW